MNNSALGNKWGNLGRSDLDCLLHDQIHVLSFRNGLRQCYLTRQRRYSRLVNFAQENFLAGYLRNLSGDFMAATVEHNHSPTRLQAKHSARVMRFRPAQNERVRIPIVRGDVKAMHQN